MQTTLNKIKLHSPCVDGWKKLLNHLGKTESDDEPLELRTILESNGIKDTLWAFRAVQGKDKEIRLFAADCSEMVLPIYEKEYPNDYRPRKAIHAARDYANGLISAGELVAARADASAAADAGMTKRAAASAKWAAVSAAWDAASAASAADAALAAQRAAADAALAAKWAAVSAAADAGITAKEAADAAWNEIKCLLLKYI